MKTHVVVSKINVSSKKMKAKREWERGVEDDTFFTNIEIEK